MSQRPFKEAYSVNNTKSESTDSDEPRVEIENTIGFKRWMALYIVAHFFTSEAVGRDLDDSGDFFKANGRISVARRL